MLTSFNRLFPCRDKVPPVYMQKILTGIIESPPTLHSPDYLGYESIRKGVSGILDFAISFPSEQFQSFLKQKDIPFDGRAVGEIFFTPKGFSKKELSRSLEELEEEGKRNEVCMLFALTSKCILDDFGYVKIPLDAKNDLDNYFIQLYTNWLSGQDQDTKIRYVSTFLKRLQKNLKKQSGVEQPSCLFFYYKILN